MKKKKIEKCEICRKRKAVFYCDDGYHYFCDECGEEDDECRICQPSYLIKI